MGFDRDLVARGLAAHASSQAEEALAAISSIPKGLSYKGQVDYYADLPSATAEVGDCYTVRYTGSSGTNPDGSEYVWGSYGGTNTWIKLGQENVEVTDNKVTTITDQSTNVQYPSAAAVYNFVNEGVPYLTTAPTEDNTSGKLKVVVLDSEPVTKYDGYLYLIAPTPPQTYTVTLYGQSWGTDIETDAQCNETFYIAFNRTPVDITTDYDYRTALSPIEIHQNHYESDFGYDLYDSTGTLQTQPVTVQNVSYATVGLRSTDYIEGTTSPYANVKVVQYDCSDINSPIGWAEMEEQNPPMWTVTIGEDQIIQVTEDMDLSLVGCVSDGYTPDPSSSSYSSSSY